jgi:hypothetical protein
VVLTLAAFLTCVSYQILIGTYAGDEQDLRIVSEFEIYTMAFTEISDTLVCIIQQFLGGIVWVSNP